MGLRENLADPWGGLIAAVAGGLTWAVIPATAGVAVPLGLGVAAAVYGAKVVASTLLASGGDEPRSELAPPPRGSAAWGWLDRTERASRTLRDLVDPAVDGATRERLSTVAEQAALTVDGMRRLASRVSVVERAMAQIPHAELEGTRTRLGEARDSAETHDARESHQDALNSVREQLAVYRRLRGARDSLLAQM